MFILSVLGWITIVLLGRRCRLVGHIRLIVLIGRGSRPVRARKSHKLIRRGLAKKFTLRKVPSRDPAAHNTGSTVPGAVALTPIAFNYTVFGGALGTVITVSPSSD